MIYLDTTVVVAYYCPENLSARAERVIRAQVHPAVSELTELEFFSALSRKVRSKELGLKDAVRIADQFRSHLEANYYTRVAIESRHYVLARGFIAPFSNALRTLDALHLAVAAVAGFHLITSDDALAGTATQLGIDVTHLK